MQINKKKPVEWNNGIRSVCPFQIEDTMKSSTPKGCSSCARWTQGHRGRWSSPRSRTSPEWMLLLANSSAWRRRIDSTRPSTLCCRTMGKNWLNPMSSETEQFSFFSTIYIRENREHWAGGGVFCVLYYKYCWIPMQGRKAPRIDGLSVVFYKEYIKSTRETFWEPISFRFLMKVWPTVPCLCLAEEQWSLSFRKKETFRR